MRILQFFFFLLWLLLGAKAQSSDVYKSLVLDTKNGLLSNNVNACIRDKKGFLWVATELGLTRYADKNSVHINANTNTVLKVNPIAKLVTLDSVIWANTWNEVFSININSMAVRPLGVAEKFGNITDLKLTKDSMLLISTNLGYLLQYDPSTRKTKLLLSFVKKNILSMCLDEQGTLFFILETPVKIVQYNLTQNKIVNAYPGPDITFSSTLACIKNVGLFLFGANGLYSYSAKEDRFIPDKMGLGVVKHAVEYEGGLAYVTSNNRVLTRDTAGRISSHILYPGASEVKRLVRDFNGDLCIVTREGLLLKSKINPFVTVRESHAFDVKTKVRRSIAEDVKRNRLFFFNYEGVEVYNTQLKKQEQHITGFKNAHDTYTDSNFIWISTEGDGLFKLNLETLKVEQVYKRYDQADNCVSLIKEPSGMLLLGMYNKLMLFNPYTKESRDLPIKYKGIVYKELLVSSIVRRNDNEVWIGTSLGIFVLNNQYQVMQRFAKDEPENFHISSNNVNCIFFDLNGAYVGLDEDIYFIPFTNHHPQSIFYSKFGSSDRVVSINKDKLNRIWFSAYSGLYCYAPLTGKIRAFHAPNYFSNNEFNRKASLMSASGKLYLGTVAGYIEIDPMNYTVEVPIYANLFNSVKISDGKSGSTNYNLSETDVIHLSPEKNRLECSFMFPDIIDLKSVKYFYTIQGLTDGWIPLNDRESVELFALPSGKWTLQVKAINYENLATVEQHLYLIVPKVFYKTVWFYVLMLILLGTLFYALYRYRINNFRKFMLYRLELANELHDTVGTYVTKTIYEAEGVLRDNPVKDERLKTIADYGRQINASFRDAVWSADESTDSVENMIDRIIEIGQAATERTAFNFEFVDETAMHKLQLTLKQKNNILQIVREAMHNIIKHSNGSHVKIFIKIVGKQFQLTIFDNGTSETNDATINAGVGFRSMRHRAKKMNAVINFQQTKTGFTVLLTFKV